MTDKELKALGTKLKVDFKKIPFGEFKKGYKTEMEHKDVTKGNPEKTARIAVAHLKECPKYYQKLAKMEKTFKKKKIAKKCAK